MRTFMSQNWWWSNTTQAVVKDYAMM